MKQDPQIHMLWAAVVFFLIFCGALVFQDMTKPPEEIDTGLVTVPILLGHNRGQSIHGTITLSAEDYETFITTKGTWRVLAPRESE